nr:hypothetical protein BaRGS_009312 [Batillaria attramentaria]
MGTILSFGIVFLLSAYLLRRHRINSRLPPGPFTLPVLGSVAVMGRPDMVKLYADFRHQYGDVFSFQLGSKVVVVINGYENLRKVFVQQGNVFADRPQVFTFTHVLQVAFLAVTLVRRYRINSRLPPGPFTLPLLGSVAVLGRHDMVKLYADFRRQYGDVFSFQIGSKAVVVINGYQHMRKVFVQLGNVFLDRPQVFTFTHVMKGKGLVSTSGEVWKEHRKFLVSTLRSLGVGKASFADKIEEELRALCGVLDATSGEDVDPSPSLQTAIANIICSIAFGERFEYNDKVFMKFLDIFSENMAISGGTAIMNFFPWLFYLPGDHFKAHKVLKNVDYVQGYLREWLDNHHRKFDPNTVRDFIDAYFKDMAEKKEQKRSTTFSYDQLLKLVGDLFVAGTETTATTLRWFFVFLVRWPPVQRRMREEIDKVYPDQSTPSIHDRHRLPYVEAAILECQRYADIAPFAVTHATSCDVELNEYFVPKGSLVIPNVNSVHFDPELWDNPDTFRPERFLDADGDVVKPEHLIPFFMGPNNNNNKNQK